MSSTDSQQSSSCHAGVRFVAVGDIMPGDSAICVGWGMASQWPGVSFARAIEQAIPLLADADVVFGNLEAPLAQEGLGASRWARDQMRASPDVANVLAQAGFTVLSVANNHAVQHGTATFDGTTQALRDAGILVAGLRGSSPWTSEPVVQTANGVRVGFLAYCWRPRQYGVDAPPFAEGDVDSARQDIRRLASSVDSVVVSLHWGDEFLEEPSIAQVRIGDDLLAAGASVIIGHHPHAVRPIKQTEMGVVAYSLGNFASDMTWLPQARVGAVLRCELSGGLPQHVSTAIVATAHDYRVRPADGAMRELEGDGLDASEYARLVAASVREQRVRAYAHALRNILKFPVGVLAELVSRTAVNRVRALWPGGER